MLGYLTGAKGASTFGSSTTAEEVASALAEKVNGKIVIVTGSSSGIGVETAKAIAKHGATLVMACRSQDSMHKVADQIRQETPSAQVHELVVDISSIASIRQFVEDFKKTGLPHINVLIHNAGVMMPGLQKSKDGVEMNMATNMTGPFLMTNLLVNYLAKGAPARVVNVASGLHRLAPEGTVHVDDMDNEKWYKTTMVGYGHSKLASILHARELDRRCKARGLDITAVSLHPGVIQTSLHRHMEGPMNTAFYTVSRLFLKNVEQGAATSVYCAFGDGIEAGGYHADCNVAKTAIPAGEDMQLAAKVWDFAEKMTGSVL